jgi:hypothetical protein
MVSQSLKAGSVVINPSNQVTHNFNNTIEPIFSNFVEIQHPIQRMNQSHI